RKPADSLLGRQPVGFLVHHPPSLPGDAADGQPLTPPPRRRRRGGVRSHPSYRTLLRAHLILLAELLLQYLDVRLHQLRWLDLDGRCRELAGKLEQYLVVLFLTTRPRKEA